ncbi:hypothetical protein EYZ11_006432 [Aspergillus tanneri]|uniref:Peptidase M48 domain-containing protein n=1 Tax=Aspergillus tanneri TaxID=1220188 RepID=A0A4S3JFJ7_9EURO|nr:hypothetical protein EYZ11_006432 [Aspergillus tanneri]
MLRSRIARMLFPYPVSPLTNFILLEVDDALNDVLLPDSTLVVRFNNEPFLFQLLRHTRPIHIVVVGGGLLLFYFYNLETVEMTGRQRFNCISAKSERKMGTKEYQQLLSDLQGKVLPENHPLTVQVNRVLHRLIPNAPLEGADWKVHVINEPNEVNAFVLPGGKVFVFTGILPVCQDDNGLAAVLGHEIAHVVAHHPAERMSHNAISMVLALVTALILDISGQLSSMLLSLAYGLPNSRIQEAEADEMGLMIMSKSCFNPEGAVNL